MNATTTNQTGSNPMKTTTTHPTPKATKRGIDGLCDAVGYSGYHWKSIKISDIARNYKAARKGG
jgi:hypothetical protein